MLLGAGAAVMDLRGWRVSNVYLALFGAAAFLYEFVFYGGSGLSDRLIAAAIPLLILWFFFYFRRIGAGDIKLLCTLGLWMGVKDIIYCMLYSFAAGAVVSLFILLTRKEAGVRVHVAVFVFIGILIKLLGGY